MKVVEAGQTSHDIFGETIPAPAMNSLDPDFIDMLRSLGVEGEQLEMSENVLNEPVEILLNLVKSDDVNPWDVDIVYITDRFFAHIEDMKMMDLRISGRTLLYAAILLRMKSTGIVVEDEEDDDFGFDDGMDFYDIEDYPVPKLPIRRVATRPVTLQELIIELKKAENVEFKRSERLRIRKVIEMEAATTDEVLGIAHEENIMERVTLLGDQLIDLFKDRTCVQFSDIVNGDRSEKILTYLTLLFLATDKKIMLAQKELFGELYIHPGGSLVDDT
ncbi:MAG TPA: segregation/condensation protein A [Methanosarcinaceae archaeon]|nr:segregation/condensation protein A [Methanosarcinaceae archaeon]